MSGVDVRGFGNKLFKFKWIVAILNNTMIVLYTEVTNLEQK